MQNLQGSEEINQEKVARYLIARNFLIQKKFNSILVAHASTGYGCKIISKTAKQIIGVSSNKQDSSKYYQQFITPNVAYLYTPNGITQLPTVDCVVCCEQELTEVDFIKISDIANHIVFSILTENVEKLVKKYGYTIEQHEPRGFLYHATRSINLPQIKPSHDVVVYLRTEHNNPTIANAMQAIIAGLNTINIEYVISPQNLYVPSKIAIVWSVFKLRIGSYDLATISQMQQLCGWNTLVVERGFIKRDSYYMLGFGGLNNRADFKNNEVDDKRINDLGIELKPWRNSGSHILVCGQVAWDASVQHTNHVQWCIDTITKLKSLTNRKILFRPHPLYKDILDGFDVEISDKSLQEDLTNCHAVVTFNTNTGVEAIINGVPVFVADKGAMSFDVANHDLSEINDPKMPDRTKWLERLAYTQWRLDEIAEGSAFKHLLKEKNK